MANFKVMNFEKFNNKNKEEIKKDDNEGKSTVLIQKQDIFESFDNNIGKDSKRIPPTSEQIEKMDKNLKDLSTLFDGFNDWHLDGALNISLFKKEYIGKHKDIDISIEREKLKDFEDFLKQKGYALFLSQNLENGDNKEKIMRRVGYKGFENYKGHPMVCAVEENGEIDKSKNLNYLDLHILDRNSDGAPLLNSGVVCPEEWAKPYPIIKDGQQINLSHPAKVLYYKLKQGRDYDSTDIDRLLELNLIKEGDIDEMKNIFEKEFSEYKRQVFVLCENISKEVKLEMNSEEIFVVIKKMKEFKEKDGIDESLKIFSEEISKLKDKSSENIFNLATKLFNINDKNKEKYNKLDDIKQIIIIRNNIENENKTEDRKVALDKEIFNYLKSFLKLKDGDAEKIESLKARDLLGDYKKQLEFVNDKRLDNVNIVIIPDDLWIKGKQPSESDAENNIILIKQSYFKAEKKPDEIAWMTHELGHCQVFLDSKDSEDYQKKMEEFAFTDIETEYSYPNNLVEKVAFTKQFQFLKEQGKSRESIIEMIKKYYQEEDMAFFDKVLNSVF